MAQAEPESDGVTIFGVSWTCTARVLNEASSDTTCTSGGATMSYATGPCSGPTRWTPPTIPGG